MKQLKIYLIQINTMSIETKSKIKFYYQCFQQLKYFRDVLLNNYNFTLVHMNRKNRQNRMPNFGNYFSTLNIEICFLTDRYEILRVLNNE